MLNNYYFKDIEDLSQLQKEFLGNKPSTSKRQFFNDVVLYLQKEYNYTLPALLNDSDLSIENFKELYEEGTCYKDVCDLLTEELSYQNNNRFNAVWSSSKHIIT